jgi:hypothetical protein
MLAILLPIELQSQVKSKSEDVFNEMENEELTLYFFDAVTGKPINGASVDINTVGTYISDDQGRVYFPIPKKDGIYKVQFSFSGYIDTEYPIEIMAGTLFFNRISISPNLNVKKFRIVLDWGKQPLDLDAHFIKQNEYHLSFRNMRSLSDGTGMLDIDAQNGFGPETITVESLSNNSSYEYSVQDYSNQNNKSSKELSKSKATIKVYGENKLIKIFQITREKIGTNWRVFKIEQGQVREINQVGNN